MLRVPHRAARTARKGQDLKVALRNNALMRQWFGFLDADGSGRVSVDELEDPLISVGLAHSRRSVENLILAVDKSSGGIGDITFDEFQELLNKRSDSLYVSRCTVCVAAGARAVLLQRERQHHLMNVVLSLARCLRCAVETTI